jgi:hypothetical protein
MSQEQRLAFYKEYMEVLTTEPLNLPMWLYLQYKFMTPTMMIARNDEMQKFIGHFSLNGIKSNICKPY